MPGDLHAFYAPSAGTRLPCSLTNLKDTGLCGPVLFLSSKEAGPPACPGSNLRVRDVPGHLCFPNLPEASQ